MSSKQVRTTQKIENGKDTEKYNAFRVTSDEGKIITTTTTITTVNGVTKEETVTKTENADGDMKEISLNNNNNGSTSKPTVVPASKGGGGWCFWKKKDEVADNLTTPKKEMSIDEYRKNALKEINDYRKKHKVNPLKLDDTLNKYAQEWAEHLAKTGSFQHRKDTKYGENLAMGSGSCADNLVALWYDEYKNYKFSNQGFAPNTGHFTQIVWKNSEKVGIGLKKTASGMTYLVANFDPPGNVQGQYKENVFDKK